MKKLYKNKGWLENQYKTLKKSLREIAKECNCCPTTILDWLKKFDIPRRSISDAMKGKEPWHKGKKVPQISGENHPRWKGDKVGRSALHAWLRKKKVKPEVCEICGEIKKLGLSFNHALGKYTRNPNDYKYLCRSCHALRDFHVFGCYKN